MTLVVYHLGRAEGELLVPPLAALAAVIVEVYGVRSLRQHGLFIGMKDHLSLEQRVSLHHHHAARNAHGAANLMRQ